MCLRLHKGPCPPTSATVRLHPTMFGSTVERVNTDELLIPAGDNITLMAAGTHAVVEVV